VKSAAKAKAAGEEGREGRAEEAEEMVAGFRPTWSPSPVKEASSSSPEAGETMNFGLDL
jgi:hypothetical protein